MRSDLFLLVCLVVGGIVYAAALTLGNDYYFFAGYVVLQYVVLATAWNILGGYCGYVNFGSAAFFALGAYSTVAIHRLYPMPIPVLVAFGGVVSGVVGFGMGYLTLRLRGAFFAIATLALAVVLETLIVNWDYVGGSRGAYIVRPEFDRAVWQLHQISVPDHDAARRGGDYCRTADRAIAARLRLRHHSRRRISSRSLRRPDIAAQADRDHDLRRTDGNGRRTIPLLHRLFAAILGIRSRLCGEFHCHAADRRHHRMGRPADRRHPSRLAAADRNRNDLVGGQSPDRRSPIGRLRHRRAQWHYRAGE